ncbi:MAG: polysaccharide biosynthesis C-terminal domain-containing protein, partial [Oscillospiraceae bacterium]
TVFGESISNIADATEKIMPYAAEYSLLGVSFASLFGTMVMIFYYIYFNGFHTLKFKKNYLKHMLPIFKIAVPISISAFIVNLYPLIDMVTIVKAFQIIFKDIAAAESYFPKICGDFETSAALGNYLYGCYSGIAMTIFHLVPALTASLSTAALPVISSLSAKDDKIRLGDTAEAVMRFSALFSIPAGMGLFIMAEPILTFLFGNSPREVMIAAPMLSVLGIAAVFVGISAPAFAVLQGMGKPAVPTFILAFFTFFKLLLSILLVSSKKINVMAAPISTLVCYFFIASIALKNISMGTLKKLSLAKICLKPFILCLFCCPLSKIIYTHALKNASQSTSLLFSILISGILYILLLQLSGEFKQHYLKMLYSDKKS